MMPFPTLTTERLILRKLKQSDCLDLFETYSSEEAMRYFGMYPMTELEQAESIINNFNKGFEMAKMIRFAIELKSNHKVIGTCGFHSLSDVNKKGEVGFEINPKFHRKGYMSEALHALLDLGFNTMQFQRIEGLVYPENISSQRTLEKQGFKREGLLRHYMIFREKPQDLYMYGLLNEEFNGN